MRARLRLLEWKQRFFFSLFPRKISTIPRSSISSQHQRDVFRWNSAITASFRSGDMERARNLFDEMPQKNLITFNCMISGFAHNGRLAEAREVFESMTVRNVVSYTALMTGYIKCGRFEQARDLFDEMPERNVVCWNSMISGYLGSGQIAKAQELFNRMPERNNVSWAIMISGYLQHKLVEEARVLFDQASSQDAKICNSLLAGYVELGRFKDAEDLFLQMSCKNVVSWNTMLTCFSKMGRMETARQLFAEMPEKDIISWTTLIHGYLQNRDIGVAQELFSEMPDRDVVVWNTMISGFVRKGMLDEAIELFHKMPRRDIVSWNTILQGYVEVGDMANARKWFGVMPRRSETSWNTLISGYRNEEALVLLKQMVREGFKPDKATIAVVLSVCASFVALRLGEMVHACAIRTGYEHHMLVSSSLITMYSRSGLICSSSQVFDSTSRRDTIMWNTMIAMYAYHGFANEAFLSFEQMVEAGFQPDQVTFLSLLSACAHKGLVDKGCRYFWSMKMEWNLDPKPEHCSCIVDLLGRSGFISNAYGFISNLRTDLQKNARETLLSACRFLDNIEIGEVTAKRVLHTQPFDGGMYIMLSNIYSSKGMWERAASIRALMKSRDVKKETGCSWIEIGGDMHSFASDDKSHEILDELREQLDNLSLIVNDMN